MSDMFKDATVIPVLTIERAVDAVPLARALAKGGLRLIEVTLRTPCALSAIADIARDVPEAIVGAGTIFGADDIDRAIQAGAKFLVSPGLTRALAQAARDAPVPFIPGVATTSEIMAARELGFSLLKFYPASIAGGPGALRAFQAIFPEVSFCPTGGITPDDAPEYLALPNVVMVGGSWIAPAGAIRAGDWASITKNAAHAAGLKRR